MKFTQHYSGSVGNLYTVEAENGDILLIECGVKWKDIQRALNYDLSRVVGCIVSHRHKDHCCALADVRRAGILVSVNDCHPRLGESLYITAHEAAHDVPCSIFTVMDVSTTPPQKLLFATDTKTIKQRWVAPFDIIAIECSYEEALLAEREKNGAADRTHAERLLESHLSKEVCMHYLDECCDLSKCRELHLLHLSRDNIADPEALRAEFEQRYLIPTFIVDGGKTPPDCTKGNGGGE